MDTTSRIAAAQYLRMSTEHQQYSMENQAAAIQDYASTHGFVVVQSYYDSGRSGVVLKRRSGLCQLIQDVVGKEARFNAILVYDVSRWGRFQDTDEAAHYEFLCKSAGVPIHYCAESFPNDGTFPSLIMKMLKRTMAGEYSRELGVKVFAGQWRVYEKGFRGSGGCPGYGLRRMLVSSDGASKQLLSTGERKGIQADRVILVPGPKEEVECIREICRMFLQDKRGFSHIARELNNKELPYRGTKHWDVSAVRNILLNPKYNGWLIYARTSRKLHMQQLNIPESQWLRVPHPSSKIIDDTVFTAIRRRLSSFTTRKSNDQLLDELRSILATHGRLSSTVIRRTPGSTSPASFRYRFGSLMRAYELIGYDVPIARLAVTRRKIQAMRLQLMEQLQMMFAGEVTIGGRGGRTRTWLRLRKGVKVSVRVCLRVTHVRTRRAWQIRPVSNESHWTALVALMNRDNTQFEEFLIFQSVPNCGAYIPDDAPWLRRGRRLHSLEMFLKEVYAVRSAQEQ